MAISNFLLNNLEFLTSLSFFILIGYSILLLLERSNYLRLLIIFELLLLFISLIFIINIHENIDYYIILLIILVGGESCLALTVIFPFILK